ncbi:MAG TPA: hypothetical protein VGJ94_18720 [Syntrophorhabdaceae bacterium]|jgi:hypothetical protein
MRLVIFSVLILAAVLSWSLDGVCQTVDRSGLEGVSGVARGAAGSAGGKAVEGVSYNTIMGVAVIAAGTGAIIAAAPEVMGISAGVAAAGLLGAAGAGAFRTPPFSKKSEDRSSAN